MIQGAKSTWVLFLGRRIWIYWNPRLEGDKSLTDWREFARFRCVFFACPYVDPWKLTWNPKITQSKRKNHLPNLHFGLPCWFSRVYLLLQTRCDTCSTRILGGMLVSSPKSSPKHTAETLRNIIPKNRSLDGVNSNICLEFSSRFLGKWNPIWLINIFQMGWFNH